MTTKTKIGSNLKGIIFLQAAKCTRVMRLVKQSPLAYGQINQLHGRARATTTHPPPRLVVGPGLFPVLTLEASGHRLGIRSVLPACGTLPAAEEQKCPTASGNQSPQRKTILVPEFPAMPAPGHHGQPQVWTSRS